MMLKKWFNQIIKAATHEAAAQGRRLRSWRSYDSGPKKEHAELATLRSRSRDAIRNNPMARSAIRKMVTAVIGTGVSPKPLIDDEKIRTQLITLWEQWSSECDFDQRTDFYGLQTLVLRSMFESGECFVILNDAPNQAISLSLRVLESDHLPFENRELSNGHRIIDGIEFNKLGQRVAYWMHPFHPADGMHYHFDALERLPANRVLHIYEATRPGQIRGIPLLSTVLVHLKLLDEFNDAQLERQKIANLFTAFIRRQGMQDEGLFGNHASDAENTISTLSLEPGTMQELGYGEDVVFSNPPGPGSDYLDFMRMQLRIIASALEIPYSMLVNDFSDSNDRVVRVAINQYKRWAMSLINNVLIPQFLKPVRNAWCDAGLLAGVFKQDQAIRETRWTAHGWPYLHPVQEVQADVLAINNKLKSRSEAMLERGYDSELIDQEIAADKKREKGLGI